MLFTMLRYPRDIINYLNYFLVTAEPCEPDFCFNDGTCTTSLAQGPICTCPFPYAGIRCETVDTSSFLTDTDKAQSTNIAIGVLVPVGIILALLAIVGASVFFIFLRYRHSARVTQGNEKEATEPATYENQSLEFDKKPTSPI